MTNPYTFADQHKPDWAFKQQALAGTLTSGTIYDPPPAPEPSWPSSTSTFTPSTPLFSPSPAAPALSFDPATMPSYAPTGGYSTSTYATSSGSDWLINVITPPDLFGKTASWFWWLLAALGALVGLGMAGPVGAGIGAFVAPFALATFYTAILVAVGLLNLAVTVTWFLIKVGFVLAIVGGIGYVVLMFLA
ncbi:MAG: hypothetical protein O7E57_06610 [Gammaproteobacteria bacterium]|nr:hypothetical protein [Gammaproteobacteria bacterium]